MSAAGMESVVESAEEPAEGAGTIDLGEPTAVIEDAGKPAEGPKHWSQEHAALAGNPTFERFKDVEALGKSYQSLQAKLSSGGVKVPGEKASPEEMSEYYAAIGRPDEAGGYFDGIARPEGPAWSDDLAVGLAVKMHEVGLTQEQGNALIQSYIESQGGGINEYNQQRANAHSNSIKALQQAWGPKEYALRLAEADNGGNAAFGEKWGDLVKVELSDGSLLGNNVHFAVGLQELGRRLGEGRMLGVESASAHSFTPASAKEKIAANKADPEFNKAYTNKDHPNHKETVQLSEDLYRAAYPEG